MAKKNSANRLQKQPSVTESSSGRVSPISSGSSSISNSPELGRKNSDSKLLSRQLNRGTSMHKLLTRQSSMSKLSRGKSKIFTTMSASEEELSKRLMNFPGGQLVMELEDKTIAGVVYSQPITSVDVLREAKYENLSNLANHKGKTLQLNGALAAEENSKYEPANFLINYVLSTAKMNGFNGVAGVTRWSGYGKWKAANPDGTPQEYASKDF